MLATLVIGLIFLAAVVMMAAYGIARTFALVYLPALLFFFLTPPIRLPGLPNMTANAAVGYAVLALAAIRWQEIAKIRFNILDGMVLLMMIPPTLSVMNNNTLWDAISKTGALFFTWVLPYFMGRIAMHDPESRRLTLKVVCISAIIIGCMAAVEARLRPYFVSRAMEQLNLAVTANEQVFNRFGLMRAQTSLGHPIDLGNCGVLLGTLILTLAPICRRKWSEPLMLAGICASGAMVVGAVSFTGMVALTFAFAFFYVFSRPNMGSKLVLPAVLAMMIGITLLMARLLMSDIPAERPTDQLEASVWIRTKIIQEGWSMAESAGLFGAGQYIETKGIGTGSIDNAYILFVLMYGWLYLLAWIIFAITIGFKGGQALALVRTPSERLPVASALAGTVATLFAMTTVYYGFVYAMLLLIVIGIFSTMLQLLQERQMTPMPLPAPRGFDVMPPQVPYGSPYGRPQ